MNGLFITNEQTQTEILPSGIVRTVKGYLNELMVVELHWKKGMVGAVHTHPHRQCSYVVSGTFEASLGDETMILNAGECVYVEPDVPHGLLALSDEGVVLDIFTPMREDFIK